MRSRLGYKSMMTVSTEALRGLLDKYGEIKRLREEAAAGQQAAPAAPALSALAARFPGALRELDQRPMNDIQARLTALQAALDGREPVALWMELWVAYHGLMRVALRIKRRRARGAAAIWLELRSGYVPQPDEPPIDQLGVQAIEEILRPPQGRLNAWVFRRLGERHGLADTTVSQLLFEPLPPSPRER